VLVLIERKTESWCSS